MGLARSSVAVLLACQVTLVRAAELRTWSDSTGNYSIQASLDRVAGDVVYLKSEAGKELSISIAQLGEADRAFLAGLNDASERPAIEASMKTIADLKAAVERQRLAAEVLQLYRQFISAAGVATGDLAAAKEDLPRWEGLAAKNAKRYGDTWSSDEEIVAMQAEASKLMIQAMHLIDVGNDEIARQTLLKASKADPEGVQADFTLGLLHALVGGHPEEARKHFLVCIRRLDAVGERRTSLQNSHLAAAMNNAAIAEVRMRSTGAALKRWRTVVEAGVVPPELIQNLGRFSDLAADDFFVKASPATSKAISELYAAAASAHTSRPYNAHVGWLYIPYLSTGEKDDAPDETQDSAAKPRRPETFGMGKLTVFGSGSGFAIAPDLVVTNRHVAEDADGFGIHQDGKDLTSRSGEVVALSDQLDLAVLRFTGLGATPIELSPETPRLAAAVRVLGFPETDVLGNNLKVTSGSIAGLPAAGVGGSTKVGSMLLLDATANHGNSGGPVIDASGRVVGVLTLGIKVEQAYTAAIPAQELREFLESINIGFSPKDVQSLDDVASAGDQAWEDVVAAASQSTFQILIMGTPARAAWAQRPDQGSSEDRPRRPPQWNGLEDRWCMGCNGVAHVSCLERACKAGALVYRQQEILRTNGGRDVSRWVTKTKRCGTCGGDGQVACPHCSGGFDNSL